MTALAWGTVAAFGVHLLWARPSERPKPVRRWRRPAAAAASGAALPLAAGAIGCVLGAVAVGGPVTAVAGSLAACSATAGRRSIDGARRDQARRLWPGLLDEIRVLTTSGGRSVPRALLDAGARVPEPAAGAFRATRRAWRVSADLEHSLGVLKGRLGEASTDLVCETLLVAHEVGGADVGRRLARLAEDRRRDLDARDLAQAKLAGARFARRFVVIVPVGMAFAGQAVGTGRAAFTSTGGQLVGLVAVTLVAACWWWAGELLRLPDEPRVFGT